MLQSKLNSESTKVITNYVVGSTRNILLGGGLAYAMQNEFYLHVPVIVIFPSIYAGYQMYNNKDNIISWINNASTIEIKN
jgi:hypothetical protein